MLWGKISPSLRPSRIQFACAFCRCQFLTVCIVPLPLTERWLFLPLTLYIFHQSIRFSCLPLQLRTVIKQGLDLPILGCPEQRGQVGVRSIARRFVGMTHRHEPDMLVAPGDRVSRASLFEGDKKTPGSDVTHQPASGTVRRCDSRCETEIRAITINVEVTSGDRVRKRKRKRFDTSVPEAVAAVLVRERSCWTRSAPARSAGCRDRSTPVRNLRFTASTPTARGRSAVVLSERKDQFGWVCKPYRKLGAGSVLRLQSRRRGASGEEINGVTLRFRRPTPCRIARHAHFSSSIRSGPGKSLLVYRSSD